MTVLSISARSALMRMSNPSSPKAMIWAAKIAAFADPSMATVATGIPDGIWTVDNSASSPSRADDFTGTPIIGSTVFAAIAPARWAALPAAAIITPKPLLSAFLAKSAAIPGVLCADVIRASKGTDSSL